jgi:hypothetical protein
VVKRCTACAGVVTALAALLSIDGSAHPTGAIKWPTVARVIEERCATCHGPDGSAQPILDGFESARANAAAIKQAVLERSMPPWYAAPGFGDLAHDPSLTPTEVGWIVDWVDAGTPDAEPGDPERTIHPVAAHERAPNLVLDVPAHEIQRASHTFRLQTGLPRDRWVTGFEIRPGQRGLVLAATLSIAPGGRVGTWAAGEGTTMLPDGVARRLPKGATLMLTMKYRRVNGRALDESSVGLFLSDGPRKQLRTLTLPCGSSRVPRHVEAFAVVAGWHFRPARLSS